MTFHPGEVWLADLGMVGKRRPVVVVSRVDPDPPRALILVVPLTTKNRGSRYEVAIPKLPFLAETSVANVQGLASVPTVRLERRLGKLPAPCIAELRAAIDFALF